MKKLLFISMICLLCSCQTHYPSYTGTYIFGTLSGVPSRANTVTGTLEIMTNKGWVNVEDLSPPSPPPMILQPSLRR